MHILASVFGDFVSDVDRRIITEYDRVSEEGFKPYGITKENIFEQRERISGNHISHPGNPFRYIDNIYVDGKYAFSIETALMFEGTRMCVNVKLIEDGEHGQT